MKDKRNFLTKSTKSKISFFLASVLLLTAAPLPAGTGTDGVSVINKGINELKGFVGNVVSEVFAADDKDYFLKDPKYTVNLSNVSSSEPYTLEDDTSTLSLVSAEKGNPTVTSPVSGAVIEIDDIADEKVVKVSVISAGGGTSSGIKLEMKGAGSKKISGRVTLSGGKFYNFNFYVKVDLEIVKTPVVAENGDVNGYIKMFSTDPGYNTLFMPIVGKGSQIRLKGYKRALPPPHNTMLDYSGSDLLWDIKSLGSAGSVVEVEQATGEVTPAGAGIAEVGVKALTDPTGKVKETKVSVIVPLKLSKTDGSNNGDYTGFIDDVKGQTIVPGGNATSMTFYTNMVDPNDLEWDIKKDGKKASDFISITNVKQKTATTASSVLIEGKRAGTYEITASLKNVSTMQKTVSHTKVKFNFTVPLTTADSTVHLNVGDTYNIYNNSNIGNITDYQYNLVYNNGVASVSQTTSVVSALKTGTEKIEVKQGGHTIFTVTIVVIDTISLSASNVTIPVGGKFNLTAVATDISTSDSWAWFSDQVEIAKVTGTGISAVVHGVAAGEATISVEHTVNGVTKRVSCKVTVTAGVTNITLTPAEKTVEVGDAVTIKATLTPQTSTGTYLYWRSSNPAIVKLENEDEHSAGCVVNAVAPGIAVITALNKENVVLGSSTITVRTAVTSIKLSENVLVKPLEDKTYQLRAITTPSNATDAGLKWTSSNVTVATVDEKTGLITFKKAGHATIICASESNPSIMATCDLTVIKSVSGIKFDKNEITIAVGETYKLSAVISPTDASDLSVVYKSLNTKVATVSNTGLVTGKQAGEASISVSTPNNKFTATCTVKVVQKATGLKLSAASLVLDVGESYTIEATFNPKTTTETKITWTSSDSSVAKVDAKGRVTAVAAGTCVINATSSNSLNATCYVTVNQPVGSIELDYTEYELAVGDEVELTVSFDSDDVTNKEVKWKSSNSKIAKVDKNGLVKGVAGGVAVITVTADENGMSANCIVTVQEPVSDIKLNKTAYNLGLRKKFTLKATLKTNSATNKKLKWSSNNKNVVTVDKNGVIFGKKLGYATITVKATDGSNSEATCRVRVVREAESLSLSDSFLAMVTGQTHKLKARVKPKNATYRKVNFKSDNTDVVVVDSKGKVTATGAGKAKITAYAKDNSGKKQVCVVQVREYVPATGITLSNTKLTMGVGDKQSIIYALSPNGTDDKVKWSSNNKAVVRVNKKGVINAIAPGSSVVTATTTSGKSASVQVTVVGLNFYELSLEQYDTYTLSVLGDVTGVVWDTENASIATVSNGVVTAKKAGTCYIYARVNGALLRCRVRIRNIR